jgi:lipid A disaccharide synthetase
MARRTVLERIVDERVGHTMVGTISVAVDRIAEEIAREVLQDDTFRRTIRELVGRRSQELLDRLLRDGRPVKKRSARANSGRTR